jgi:hypothetical protein
VKSQKYVPLPLEQCKWTFKKSPMAIKGTRGEREDRINRYVQVLEAEREKKDNFITRIITLPQC